MRTGIVRVVAGVVATAIVSMVVFSGCSASIKVDGLNVTEAGKPVAAALVKLKTDNRSALESGSTTVSDKTAPRVTKCWRRTGEARSLPRPLAITHH